MNVRGREDGREVLREREEEEEKMSRHGRAEGKGGRERESKC